MALICIPYRLHTARSALYNILSRYNGTIITNHGVTKIILIPCDHYDYQLIRPPLLTRLSGNIS